MTRFIVVGVDVVRLDGLEEQIGVYKNNLGEI